MNDIKRDVCRYEWRLSDEAIELNGLREERSGQCEPADAEAAWLVLVERVFEQFEFLDSYESPYFREKRELEKVRSKFHAALWEDK